MTIALAALSVSFFTFRLEWRKPFRLTCTIRGLVWYPPSEGRPGNPFSIILPIVLRNLGARPGIVEAAYIRLLRSSPLQEFRLEALFTVDTILAIQLAGAKDHSEAAKALRGIGAFVQLGKYEAKEIGIHFVFPPEDAKRYTLFTNPTKFTPGDYRLELWCCIEGRWSLYAEDPVATMRDIQLEAARVGQPTVNISGAIYDTAPGAPRAGESP